jgi:hypothetical protein
MAHFAQLDQNNTVLRVIAIGNDVCGEPTLAFPETCAAGRAFIANTLKLDGVWRQTSYNANFRGIYAGEGCTYEAEADVFIAPQPFPSWTLDENHDWQPPVAMPTEGGPYMWDEDTLTWLAVTAG